LTITSLSGHRSIMKIKEARGIQSIDVSGRILEAFLRMPAPVMLKEISTKTGIAPAQVHAYLSSLKRMDLVVQNGADGRYELGPLALQLGLAYQTSVHPMRAASATLSIIEARTGYLSALVIWNSAGPTVFEVRAGREPMNVNIRPGTVFPITGSGVGAVFAAFLPAADIKPLLQKERGDDLAAGIGWRMTAEEFGARKTDARTCGFVAVAGQPIGGVNSIAMPILDASGELIASILMLGNEGSMDIACGGALYDDVRAIMRDRTADLR
jgi:DNA-binding IclR family transcriptional regulator